MTKNAKNRMSDVTLSLYDDEFVNQVWEIANAQRKMLSADRDQIVVFSTPYRSNQVFYHMYLRAVESAKDLEGK
jgi:hypothetical protein